MSRYDPDAKYVYISNLPNKDMLYVEGSYHPDFKEYLKHALNGVWDSDNKRWAVDKKHTQSVKVAAKNLFGSVMYSEGGDYEII